MSRRLGQEHTTLLGGADPDRVARHRVDYYHSDRAFSGVTPLLVLMLPESPERTQAQIPSLKESVYIHVLQVTVTGGTLTSHGLMNYTGNVCIAAGKSRDLTSARTEFLNKSRRVEAEHLRHL